MDNPVGTGYSYVDDVKLLTTNVTGIAQDLLQLFASFLKTHPIFQVTHSIVILNVSVHRSFHFIYLVNLMVGKWQPLLVLR